MRSTAMTGSTITGSGSRENACSVSWCSGGAAEDDARRHPHKVEPRAVQMRSQVELTRISSDMMVRCGGSRIGQSDPRFEPLPEHALSSAAPPLHQRTLQAKNRVSATHKG